MDRRTFLIGGTSALTVVVVAACTSPPPDPAPTPTESPTPTPTASPVPEPAGIVRSSWSTDPYARGSASYLGVGSTPEHRSVLGESVADRLFFAGEATSVDLPATVVGARRTGTRAATEVIAAGRSGERIAVIGAGIAGATAARRLADEGFDVTVLEARERVGGRIATQSDDDWGMSIELGAGSFDSETAIELRSALRELDIETRDLALSRTLRGPGGRDLEPSTIGADAVLAAIAVAESLPGDVSLTVALGEVPVQGLPAPALPSPALPSDEPAEPEAADDAVSAEDLVNGYLRNVIAVDYGADVDELSARHGLDDGPRRSDTLVVGGYGTIVTDALDGLAVWTTNVVSAISYDENGVSIRVASGESLQVDRVVVTVPLGVLKSGDIRFEPRLPIGHVAASIALEMGTVEKVWMRFDEAFWDTDAVHWSVVGGDLDITAWVNLEPSTGSPVLVGIVGGERAVALAELDDRELVDRARRSLEPFLAR